MSECICIYSTNSNSRPVQVDHHYGVFVSRIRSHSSQKEIENLGLELGGAINRETYLHGLLLYIIKNVFTHAKHILFLATLAHFKEKLFSSIDNKLTLFYSYFVFKFLAKRAS